MKGDIGDDCEMFLIKRMDLMVLSEEYTEGRI